MAEARIGIDTEIPSWWRLPLRITWIMIAVLLLGMFTVGLSPQYAELTTICTSEPCIVLALTPSEFEILERYGISLEVYAIFQMLLEGYIAAIFAGLAILIFWGRSDTRVGYIISLTFLFMGLIFFTEELRTLTRVIPELSFMVTLFTALSVGMVIMLFYTFPDGQYVPRWLSIVVFGSIALLVLDVIIIRTEAQASSASLLVVTTFIVTLPFGLISQVYRYRKHSNAVQHQQTKWIIFGFLGLFSGMLPWAIFIEINPLPHGPERLIFYLSQIPQYIAISLFPIAIALSISRYRLWDIDLLIRWTLQYALLSGSLVLVYFGSITLLQSISTAAFGLQSPVFVVISTLAIAALFNPLRTRFQDFIDRRFYRTKNVAEQSLARFAETARDEVDMDKLTFTLMDVVNETMQPESLHLMVHSTGGKSK